LAAVTRHRRPETAAPADELPGSSWTPWPVRISGVYGGAADPLPMMQLFDKQIQLRMGHKDDGAIKIVLKP
jgi:hypothetical protein